MELLPDDYILGYWFLSNKNHDAWYVIIIKRNNEWKGQVTFRWNKSDKYDDSFSGKDKKTIYDVSIPVDQTEEQVTEDFDKVWERIKPYYDSTQDKWLVQGNIDKFFKIAKTKEYMHIKEIKTND